MKSQRIVFVCLRAVACFVVVSSCIVGHAQNRNATMIGVARRPAPEPAIRAGHHGYSADACVAGVIHGMCGSGRRRQLVWRQPLNRRNLRHGRSFADYDDGKRCVFSPNLNPFSAVATSRERVSRHDPFCGSYVLELQSDSGTIFGTARNPSRSRERAPAIVKQRLHKTIDPRLR
jgi:hypothetical protein